MTTFDNALEAWLKWKRVGEGLGEVLGSSPSGDKKFTYQKKKKKKKPLITRYVACFRSNSMNLSHCSQQLD